MGDLDARLAYGHTNFETGASYAHRLDGVLASLGYKFGDFTLTGDFAYGQVLPASKVYGNYLYERVKGENTKDKTHGFLLGADYQLHKQVVLFVEGKYVTTKEYVNDTYDGKTKDRAIGVGMRVYF